MVVRKRRKKEKLRGKRSHGKGNTKNKRGAGCRGGRGRAGSHKHKYTKYYKDFGTNKKLKIKGAVLAINLSDLSQKLPKLLENNRVEKEGDAFVIDGNKIGYGKILGRGSLKEKIVVRNMEVSKKAAEIIESAGGKVEATEKETKGEVKE